MQKELYEKEYNVLPDDKKKAYGKFSLRILNLF